MRPHRRVTNEFSQRSWLCRRRCGRRRLDTRGPRSLPTVALVAPYISQRSMARSSAMAISLYPRVVGWMFL